MSLTYVMGRARRVGGEVRPAGAPVPEAATWPKRVLESSIRTGEVRVVEEPHAAAQAVAKQSKSKKQ